MEDERAAARSAADREKRARKKARSPCRLTPFAVTPNAKRACWEPACSLATREYKSRALLTLKCESGLRSRRARAPTAPCNIVACGSMEGF